MKGSRPRPASEIAGASQPLNGRQLRQNFGPEKEPRRPWNWRMRRNRVRAVDSADRARAMTFRIAASILAIFAAGGLIAPVATPAQGGPFNGGRTAPFHSVFRAQTPAIAPLRSAVARARIHAAPFGQLRHRRTPAVVWGAAPWYDAYDTAWDSGTDALSDSGFDAPRWYGGSDAPGYAGAGTLWYSGSGIPWYGGVENPTYAVPGRNPSDTTSRNAMPPRLTCRTQTYQVRSTEDGGERAVNIVRC